MDIDLLDDERLQASMAAASLWILVIGILFGVLGATVLPHEPITIIWFILLVAVSLVALPVHELVHALAFKLFSGGRARIRFGFSNWMLYTMAPGCMLPRIRFCAVLLAPSVVVTMALGFVPAVLGYPLLGWFVAVVHLSGCTGDMAYVRIILGEPRAMWVEDTERGIALFRDA